MTGPPLSISLDFIADGLVEMVAGLARPSVLFGFRWWAPIVLGGAWLATHWLLRESGVWKDRNTDEVRSRPARRRLRLPAGRRPARGQGAAALRAADWVLERFIDRRRPLHELQYEATRMRERSVLSSLVLVVAANVVVLLVAGRRRRRRPDRPRRSPSCTPRPPSAPSMIAFGGLNWALDGAAAPGGGRRSDSARRWRGPARCRAPATEPADGHAGRGDPVPRGHVRLPRRARTRRCSRVSTSTIPAGSSLAIVGQNGAGKTTLAKLLCRLYDPMAGAIEVDGADLRDLDLERLASAGSRPSSRTSSASSCRCATTSHPAARPTTCARRAGRGRGRPAWPTSTRPSPRATGAAPTSPAGSGSASPWPGRSARCRQGAGVVLLDEPTAQLDVRGEAEIFERILAATRGVHHDPRLAPVLDGAPRRPHLRAGARAGGRARDPRRAHGRRRALPDDVRPPGRALRRRRGRRRRRGGGHARCPR